jgi:hypothetical protein
MTEEQWNSRFDLWAVQPLDGPYTLSVERKLLLYCSAYLSQVLARHPCPACQDSLWLFDEQAENPRGLRDKWNAASRDVGHIGPAVNLRCRTRELFRWTAQAISGMSTFLELWFNIVWRTGGFTDHNEFFRFTDLDWEGRRQFVISRDIDLDSWAEGMTYVREIFVNPFRPVTVHSGWFKTDAVDLARTIYADRAFHLLPDLAGTLEKAGCDQLDILAHCRSDGPHVRGCWVTDLVLGCVK